MFNLFQQAKGACSVCNLAKDSMGILFKTVFSGAMAALVTAGGLAGSLFEKVTSNEATVVEVKKDEQEGVKMKKSTLIAIFVALAAVAGVLGALYVYVLRREKELDEYEQLLFSEEFNDDFVDEPLEMDASEE